MGVHDLWKLLKPCGTVVDLASLQGKTLAIDASIWLTQFLKAMRDEETGQMTEYAHLLGTIRRICKLLYYGIKPVFVFDGGVPLLKTQVMRNRRNKTHIDESRRQVALRRMLANQLVLNGAKTTHSVPAAAAIATTTTTTTQAAKVMEEEEEEEDANYKRRTYYKLGEFQTPTTSLNHAEFSQVQLTQFLSDAKRKKEEKDAKKAAVAVENGPEQRRKLLRGDATLEYTLVLDSEAINGTKQLVEEEEEDEEDVVVVVKRPKLTAAVVTDLVLLSEGEENGEPASFAALVDDAENECLALLVDLLDGAMEVKTMRLLLWRAVSENADADAQHTELAGIKSRFVERLLQLLQEFGNTEAHQSMLFDKSLYFLGEDSALSVGEKEEESELEFGEELEEEELEEKPLGFEKELEEEELEESELEFGEEEEELQVEGVHDIVEVASPVKQPRLETIHVLSDDDDEEEEEENIEKGTDVVALEVSEDDDDQGVQPSEHQDQLQTVGKEPAAPLVYAIEEEDKPPTTTTTTTTHRITPPQQFVPPASFLAAQAAQAAAASTTTPISQAISKLELAKQQLKLEHNRASRDADTVTPEMKHEVMAVLELFGLPYVQSPMEAEAQCAALELAGLVHGVVTEDSDVFLFGARHVYKNLFTTDTGKQISAYLAQDIAEQFSIHREQFISLALLLGSDYTEGVNGIGIVNALEVLSAFPNLEEFKLWMDSGELDDGEDDVTTQFKLSHANARRRWGLGLSPNFPSLQVREAYDHPAVLDNPGPFVFREPDLEAIRSLCVDKLRMPEDRVKKQVIEALVRPSAPTQTTLDGFVEIQGKQRFAAIQSKRMAKAVQGLKRAQYDDDEEEGGEQATILAVDNLGNVVPLNRKAKG